MTHPSGYKLHGKTIIVDQASAVMVIAMLVAKLGGKVVLKQEDVDAIAGMGLGELVEGEVVTFSLEMPFDGPKEVH